MVEPWAQRFEFEAPAGVQGLGLRAAAALYGQVARARAIGFERGWLGRVRVSRPVISVGNLTVGGNGKTPFVRHLVERLAPRRIAIVTRGYRRPERTPEPHLVSRFGEVCSTVARAGDEAMLLARSTPATVIVAADRVRGAQEAIALGAELILLDDAFQHRWLARDLDLLLLDGSRPFGNGCLLPAGPLREPPSALARADLLVVVRRGEPHFAFPPEFPQVEIDFVPRRLSSGPLESLAGARVHLLSAIGRPHRFVDTALRLGAEVVGRSFFPDHHRLSARELEQAASAAERAGARLLTTEKDADRHPEFSAWEILEIEPRFLSGELLLTARLSAACGDSA